MWSSILPTADLSLRTQCLLSQLFALHGSSKNASKLLGKPQTYQPIAWEEEVGLIPQMKMSLFFLLDEMESEPLHQLNKEIDRLWIGGIAAIEKKKTELPLLKNLNRFAKPMSKFLISLPPNENLYLFLLRHQGECHALFGPRFLNSFFLHAHPQGLKQTERFLLQRYQKRGFNNLTNMIQKLITELGE